MNRLTNEQIYILTNVFEYITKRINEQIDK